MVGGYRSIPLKPTEGLHGAPEASSNYEQQVGPQQDCAASDCGLRA